jgi:hypothetical protein
MCFSLFEHQICSCYTDLARPEAPVLSKASDTLDITEDASNQKPDTKAPVKSSHHNTDNTGFFENFSTSPRP